MNAQVIMTEANLSGVSQILYYNHGYTKQALIVICCNKYTVKKIFIYYNLGLLDFEYFIFLLGIK